MVLKRKITDVTPADVQQYSSTIATITSLSHGHLKQNNSLAYLLFVALYLEHIVKSLSLDFEDPLP